MTADAAERLRERVARLPLFDAGDYAAAGADLGGLDPLDHYVRHGLDEGRWPARPARVAARLGELAAAPWPRPSHPDADEAAVLLHRPDRRRWSVTTPCAEPPAVREAAGAACAGFARLGLVQAEGPAAPNDLRMVVCSTATAVAAYRACGEDTPHVLLVAGLADDAARVAALPALLRARAVAACDPVTVRVLQAAGTPALLWCPVETGAPEAPEPGASDPLVAGLTRAARRPLPAVDVWSERPVDLMAVGPEGGAYAQVLGRAAAVFARRACVIVHRRRTWILPGEPLLAETTAAYLHRRAKLVLNIRPGHASALDWSFGVLDAMANGAVAVSTPCFPHPFLTAGAHYLEETAGRIPGLVDWLLDTAEGRRTAERVREAAAAVLRRHASPVRTALSLLRLAAGAQDRERGG